MSTLLHPAVCHRPTYTEVLPPRKSSPKPALNWTPGENPGTGQLVIHTERASVEYTVATIPTDWAGRAFHFEKLTAGTDQEAESYDVFVGRTGQGGRCECKGFLRHRHCKHIDSAIALIANQWA